MEALAIMRRGAVAGSGTGTRAVLAHTALPCLGGTSSVLPSMADTTHWTQGSANAPEYFLVRTLCAYPSQYAKALQTFKAQ